MSQFKDIVQRDCRRTFLNLKEFGDEHIIENKVMTVLIDSNEMVDRESRHTVHDEGLFKSMLLIYVLAEEFGQLPAVGRTLSMDKKQYIIVDAINEDGIYSITLEANRSGRSYS